MVSDARLDAATGAALAFQHQCTEVLSQLSPSAAALVAPLLASAQAVLTETLQICRSGTTLLEETIVGVAGGVPNPPPPHAVKRSHARSGAPGRSWEDGKLNATKIEVGEDEDMRRLLPMCLTHLNHFVHLGCSADLLALRVFPNAQEISESMGVLAAVSRCAPLKFNATAVTCVCVGDGACPRTAALACYRTKWQRIISIDPALKVSPVYNSIDRLELHAAKIEAVSLQINPAHTDVLVLLPHAHVVPNVALGALRLEAGHSPRVTVVQVPCCNYEWQDRVAGLDADDTFTDHSIASSRRRVRVWRDVFAAAVACDVIFDGEHSERRSGLINGYPLSCSEQGGRRKAKRETFGWEKKPNWYVVVKGRQPGIYSSLSDCQAQVMKFKGSQFRSFKTEAEARAWDPKEGEKCDSRLKR